MNRQRKESCRLQPACAVCAGMLALVCAAPAEARVLRSEPSGEGGKIYTVLRKDGIPAILKPEMTPASKARLRESEPVIGVVVGGEARAYSTWLLNRHEIVNDEAAGKKFAVVW